MAVEAAFPQCAIFQLRKKDVKSNRKLLSSLREGWMYGRDGWNSVHMGRLIAGSRAEGLAIEDGWGHPAADMDNMKLLVGPLGVHVPHGRQHQRRSALRYRPDYCPSAYCKIEVTDVQTIKKVNVWGSQRLDPECFKRSEGVDWLHTNNMLRRIQGRNINGPAGQSPNGLYENVPTLVCSDAHPALDLQYIRRHRHGWPSSQQLDMIKRLPKLLVLVGHRHCGEFPLQARISWSHAEMKLTMSIPLIIKQVYIALKYVFKCFMVNRYSTTATDGRSHIGSYHLKTVFLHHLESIPHGKMSSQFNFMVELLSALQDHIKTGILPHYFLPECNLLTTVGPEERDIACNVIHHIRSDPLRAILTCPIQPQNIYGEVQPDALVTAFHRLLHCPTCVRSHDDLQQLLSYLDERRLLRYNLQKEQDDTNSLFHGKVHGRDELTGLVEMLHKRIYRLFCLEWVHITLK